MLLVFFFLSVFACVAKLMGLSSLTAYLVLFSALRMSLWCCVLPGGAAAGTLKGAAGLTGSPAQTSAPPFWAPQRGVSLPLPSPNRVSTGGFILGGALLRAVPAPRGVSSLVEW